MTSPMDVCSGKDGEESASIPSEIPDLSALKDPSFLESIPNPLGGFGLDALSTNSSGRSSTAVVLDELEIQLRNEALKLLGENSNDIGEFWKNATKLCWHMVYMSENDTENIRYKDLGALRKLPILLLEDILDSTPLNKALDFYNNHAKSMFPLLFGQLLWRPDQKVRPCWLPFLKLANKFTKRLSGQPAQNFHYKDAISSIMVTLCQIYPLSEKSATRIWGSYNDQSVTTFEGREEFDEEQATILEFLSTTASGSDDDDGEDGAVPDYTIYEAFWKVQQDFSRPNLVPVMDFKNRLKSLVTSLEHNAAPKNSSTSSTEVLDRISRSTSRYLTSSRLLSMQLQDADFHIPILMQVLIVCHHLMKVGPSLRDHLTESQSRAKALLQKVSREHYDLSQSILATSEESWRQWKKNKCSPDLDQRKSESLIGRKRKPSALGAMSSLSDGADRSKESLDIDLKAVSRKMHQTAPSVKDHLEEYADALDPESGIEAEYHPKNNALFCWRAMRLLSTKHLSDLHLLSQSGDFERVVRTVYPRDYGVEIPGPMPEEDEEESEDEEEKGDEESPEDVEMKEEHEEKSDGKQESMDTNTEKAVAKKGEEDEEMVDTARDDTAVKDETKDAPVSTKGVPQSRDNDGKQQHEEENRSSGINEKKQEEEKGSSEEIIKQDDKGGLSKEEKDRDGEERLSKKDMKTDGKDVVKVEGPQLPKEADVASSKDKDEEVPAHRKPTESQPKGGDDEPDDDEVQVVPKPSPQRYVDLSSSRDSKWLPENNSQQRRDQPSQRRGGSDYRSGSRVDDHRGGGKREGADNYTSLGGKKDDHKYEYDRPSRGDDNRGSRASGGRSSGDDRGGNSNSDRYSSGRTTPNEGRSLPRDKDHRYEESTRNSGDGGRSSDDRGGNSRKPPGNDGRGSGSRSNNNKSDDTTRGKLDTGGMRHDDRGGRPTSRGGEDRSSNRDDDNRLGGGWSNEGTQLDDVRSTNYGGRDRSMEHRGGGGRYSSDDRGNSGWGSGDRSGDRRSDDRRSSRGDRRGGEDHGGSGGGGSSRGGDWRGGGDRSRSRGSAHRGDRRHRH